MKKIKKSTNRKKSTKANKSANVKYSIDKFFAIMKLIFPEERLKKIDFIGNVKDCSVPDLKVVKTILELRDNEYFSKPIKQTQKGEK